MNSKLRFLCNIFDPEDEYAHGTVIPLLGETLLEAWRSQCEWLKDKVIGDPQATQVYTVEQLKAMKMVGVYMPKEINMNWFTSLKSWVSRVFVRKTTYTGRSYWHCHHDLILEPVWDYAGRVKYIQENKPIKEQELRLLLFQPVKGVLPESVVTAGQACVKARQTLDQSRQAYNQAWQVLDQARPAYEQAWKACYRSGQVLEHDWQALDQARPAYEQALQAYDQARQVLDQAGTAYNQVWKAYDQVIAEHRAEIEALHQAECPDCPWDWDRMTIFSEGEK